MFGGRVLPPAPGTSMERPCDGMIPACCSSRDVSLGSVGGILVDFGLDMLSLCFSMFRLEEVRNLGGELFCRAGKARKRTSTTRRLKGPACGTFSGQSSRRFEFRWSYR